MSVDEIRVRRVRAFLKLAEEEFGLAKDIRSGHRRQSAYFLQQATEKLLRGVLEVEGIPAGPTHSIRFLSDLLPTGHSLKQRFLPFDVLSSAATRFRYPGPTGNLSDVRDDELDVLTAKVGELLDEVSPLLRAFVGEG